MTHHPIHLLIGTQLSQIVHHLEDQSLSRLKPTLYRDEVRGWLAKLAANDPEALTQRTLTDLLFAARWAVLSELDMRCHVPPNSDDEPIVTMEAPGTVIPLRQLQKSVRKVLIKAFGAAGEKAVADDIQQEQAELEYLETGAKREGRRRRAAGLLS